MNKDPEEHAFYITITISNVECLCFREGKCVHEMMRGEPCESDKCPKLKQPS